MVGASDKCTFGIRMPIDIHMLNAIISREVKHFRNYKIYRPNFGALPVSGKFHAAHDLQIETKEQKLKIDDYCNKVKKARAMGPRTKYSAPVTSNHEYGWYYKPLVNVDRNDRRFYQPITESIETKVEIIILTSNPKNKLKT
ncbi:protein FAM183A-like [Papilio machaon]|uniref:protein FAM183A-like n=1 Tax=Papilio machaon TaxID=76193 RepID=UPI001E662F1B|nr:protein FAM183A-like [Papilio machaon]